MKPKYLISIHIVVISLITQFVWYIPPKPPVFNLCFWLRLDKLITTLLDQEFGVVVSSVSPQLVHPSSFLSLGTSSSLAAINKPLRIHAHMLVFASIELYAYTCKTSAGVCAVHNDDRKQHKVNGNQRHQHQIPNLQNQHNHHHYKWTKRCIAGSWTWNIHVSVCLPVCACGSNCLCVCSCVSSPQDDCMFAISISTIPRIVNAKPKITKLFLDHKVMHH